MNTRLLQQAQAEWRELLSAAEAGDSRCSPYVALFNAVLQENLARVFPYLSMWTLRLSLRPTYPWDQTGLPDIDYDSETPDRFSLDEGPSQTLAQTIETLRPILQAAQVYEATAEVE